MIVAVDGKKVASRARTAGRPRRQEAGHDGRGSATGAAARCARWRSRRSRTREDPKRAIIGVSASDDLTVKLPVRIKIDAGGVGGPSAGLAFALDILQELGRNVAHGHKVAATGELALDGTVGPIGGVKQKTIGARKAGVDVFLVPAGENAREARRYAEGLRIIPVKNFQQALRALATLAPKA